MVYLRTVSWFEKGPEMMQQKNWVHPGHSIGIPRHDSFALVKFGVQWIDILSLVFSSKVKSNT